MRDPEVYIETLQGQLMSVTIASNTLDSSNIFPFLLLRIYRVPVTLWGCSSGPTVYYPSRSPVGCSEFEGRIHGRDFQCEFCFESLLDVKFFAPPPAEPDLETYSQQPILGLLLSVQNSLLPLIRPHNKGKFWERIGMLYLSGHGVVGRVRNTLMTG